MQLNVASKETLPLSVSTEYELGSGPLKVNGFYRIGQIKMSIGQSI